jgi:hypothetical protein
VNISENTLDTSTLLSFSPLPIYISHILTNNGWYDALFNDVTSVGVTDALFSISDTDTL